jgi:hypothetical protein
MRTGSFKGILLAGAAVALVTTATPAAAKDKPTPPSAAAPGPHKTYDEATAGLQRQDGLLPVFVDKAGGRVLLSLPAPDAEGISGRYLYLTALRTGLGSAPVGLDRAKVGETQILHFRRYGKKVAAEFENTRFRAEGAPADEQQAARQAFSPSLVWAGDIVAEAPDGRLLVDISSFLTRDAMGVAESLKQADEPGFRQVADLSLPDLNAIKVFPENLEFEAVQTFSSETPGPEVRNIAPDPHVVTLTLHHSLVKLPDPGYQPRRFDPRTGTFSEVVVDYAAPLGDDLVRRLAPRFRLEKIDPTAARSPVKKPIVFYVDRGAPEPIRTALVEGARWWAQAFDAAGYIDAFRVEVMPEGADPLDVRYNVINWVDRATRGWSYGQAVSDPRTGEIVKGSVLLGSLRVRQDVLIYEGLVGAVHEGTGGPNDPVQVALERLRQLAAHEVGHALGFAHNFAGSTQDRASVMDYPAPRVLLKDGRPDLSDAYGVGVGRWDRFAVDWLYGDAAAGPAKIAAAQAQGLRYLSDADARPAGAAQPWASLWDDGPDPAAELNRMMQVRHAAIASFGPSALKPGEPMADLRRKYVPIYLLHRYQLQAAGKMLAGVDYSFAVNGDRAAKAPLVPGADQRRALDALLHTLDPAELDTPEALTPLLSGGLSGEPDRQFDIEILPVMGDPVFDPLAAADVAAGLTLDMLLAPDRLSRLVDQHRRDPAEPGAGEVLGRLIDTAFDTASVPARQAEIRQRVQTRVVLTLAQIARAADASPEAKGEIETRLRDLAVRLKAAPGTGAERAHRLWLADLLTDKDELTRALARPGLRPAIPPGMPIGAGEDDSDGL